jgi:hypothetical protein
MILLTCRPMPRVTFSVNSQRPCPSSLAIDMCTCIYTAGRRSASQARQSLLRAPVSRPRLHRLCATSVTGGVSRAEDADLGHLDGHAAPGGTSSPSAAEVRGRRTASSATGQTRSVVGYGHIGSQLCLYSGASSFPRRWLPLKHAQIHPAGTSACVCIPAECELDAVMTAMYWMMTR